MTAGYPRRRCRLARRKAATALDGSTSALRCGDVDEALRFAQEAVACRREAAAWRELARLERLGAALDRAVSEAKRLGAGRN